MNAIVMNTEEYLVLKLGLPLPRDIIKALAISLKTGLGETMSCAGELSRYNKELPTKVFNETGGLEVKTRNRYDQYVDLSNIDGFMCERRVIWD